MKLKLIVLLTLSVFKFNLYANGSNTIYDSGDSLEKVRCGSSYCPEITREAKEAELKKAGFSDVMCIYYNSFGNRYGLRCVGTVAKQEDQVCAEITKQLIEAARDGELTKVDILSQILAENSCDDK